MNDPDLPHVLTEIPGPRSREMAARLDRVESPDATFFADDFPMFEASASGCMVTDADGNRFLDLNAGFGVAAVGHSHPRVAAALADQSVRMIHGMGDVHPTELKLRLAESLVRLAPGGNDWKVIFSVSGAEAVEAAVKTAMVATGRSDVIVFEDAYHGLSFGTLPLTAWPKFRRGFEGRIAGATHRFPFPTPRWTGFELEGVLASVRKAITSFASVRGVAAVLVEPILGRGGVILPPPGFLPGLRSICDETETPLIFDEIYTGFGRTGAWFRCEAEGVAPDLLAVGKAMGGGMPVSACLGRAALMDRWGRSEGEARHTSTFLGHPLACRAALEVIDILESGRLIEQSAASGARLLTNLKSALGGLPCVAEVRGAGMMIGIELTDGARAWRAVTEGLRRGLILLPSGPRGSVLSITPPLVLTDRQADHAVGMLAAILRD